MDITFVVIVVVVVAAIVLTKRKKQNENKPTEPEQTPVTVVAKDKPVETDVYWYEDGVKKWGKIRMAQGIQIFNSDGGLIFDLSNSTTYVLGSGQTGTSAGSLSDARIVAGRTWVVTTSGSSGCVNPIFTVSDGIISWTFSQVLVHGSVQNVTFMYGVWS